MRAFLMSACFAASIGAAAGETFPGGTYLCTVEQKAGIGAPPRVWKEFPDHVRAVAKANDTWKVLPHGPIERLADGLGCLIAERDRKSVV